MSGDGGSDMAANAWPGFVDILSAVVIMFVFFVLITAAVLYFYTITYKAKVEGAPVISTEVEESTSSAERVTELEAENSELREQVESVQAQLSQSAVGQSEEETTEDAQEVAQAFAAQASEQEVRTSSEDLSLVLFHDAGAITVGEKSEERISTFIAEMVEQYGAENVEIQLSSPKVANAETQSRERRLAVARLLNVRNSLLDTMVDRGNIQLKVVENEAIDDSDNWTRLKVNILK